MNDIIEKASFPRDWDVLKMRQCFSFGKGLSITKEDLVEEGIPVISYGQVHSKDNTGTGLSEELYRYVPDSFLKTGKSCLVQKNDFIFADTSEDYAGVGNCAFIDNNETIFAGYHSIIARPVSDSLYPKYLAYLFLTDLWRDQIRANVMGIKVFSITQQLLRDTYICVPSVSEQKRIVELLDESCSKLDKIIANLERQIELLQKYKKSIITETVTKGLNKNVEMKDSGNRWIGMIPKKWNIKRVLYLLQMPITDGPHTTPDMQDDGIPFVSAEAVSTGNGHINFDNIWGYITPEFYRECCKKYVPQMDDIYMIKSGATTGKVAIVETSQIFTVWSPLAVFRCNKEMIIPKYMFYSLQADYFQTQVELGWTYGTQQNIGMRTLEHLKICQPPMKEQEAIVQFLDERSNKIDRCLIEKERQLELMQKHKASLIYEYITGKKRVKEVV